MREETFRNCVALTITGCENAANEKTLRDLLMMWSWLLAGWVRNLYVRVNPRSETEGDETQVASIVTDPKYLRAVLKVWPEFWAQSESEQDAYIAHEFYHTIRGKADSFVEETILDYVRKQNSDLADMFLSQYNAFVEEETEEFALAVTREYRGFIPPDPDE